MLLFWALAFALAWLITLPPALTQTGLIGSSPIPHGIGILIGLTPLLAAVIVAAREKKGRAYWRSLLRLPKPSWTAAFALFVPPLLLALAYFAHAAAGAPIKVTLDASLAGYALLWLVLAFGEEAGWRGLALPRLTDRYGFWTGSLILGPVWCVWHYPKLLGSPYLGSLSEALPLIALFSAQIVIANFIICWLYFRSGRSVIAATIYHAAFNLIATAYFMAATDLVITGLLAGTVLLIAIFDPRPDRTGAASSRYQPAPA